MVEGLWVEGGTFGRGGCWAEGAVGQRGLLSGGVRWAEGAGRQREQWKEGAIVLRERSDCLAASEVSRAVQDRAPRSEAQRSAVQTARNLII